MQGLMYWVFITTFCFLPFSFGVANFEVGIVTLNPYIMGMVAVAIMGFIRWTLGKSRGLFRIYDFVVFFLAFTFMASTLLSDNVIEAGYLAFHALFVPIVTQYAIRSVVDDNKKYDMTIYAFAISVSGFCIYFIYEFMKEESRLNVLGNPPIGVATLCVITLIFVFRNTNNKKLNMLIMSVLVIALFLTFSRMYLASFIIAPFMWRWIRRGKSMALFSVFMAATFVLTIFVALNADMFIPSHFDKTLEKSVDRLTDIDFLLGTIYGRAVSYEKGISIFLDSPVVGAGLFKGEHMVTQHNFHIEWLEYGGVIGYILYASVILLHVRYAGRYAPKDKTIAGNILGIAIVLMNSVTNGIMHGVMPTALFILMGLSEARMQMIRKNTVRYSRMPRSGVRGIKNLGGPLCQDRCRLPDVGL